MTDGTTLTRTTPLAELHPDAPITITRRQLVAACRRQVSRMAVNYRVPEERTAQWIDALDWVAEQDADRLLGYLLIAAKQIEQEQSAREIAA